jgi:hypothetical protein
MNHIPAIQRSDGVLTDFLDEVGVEFLWYTTKSCLGLLGILSWLMLWWLAVVLASMTVPMISYLP